MSNAMLSKLNVPAAVDRALRDGAALAISVSGGKDSQALLEMLVALWNASGYTGKLFAVHADLGRAEWHQTPAFVEAMCLAAGVPLLVVRRTKGDLVARFEERIVATRTSGAPFWPSAEARYCTSHLKGGPIDSLLRDPAPFWPSAEARYCTSDHKRNPIDVVLRPYEIIISAEGVRADESRERAKKPVLEVRKSITAGSTKTKLANLKGMTPTRALKLRKPGKRVALNWRPLLGWSESDVWEACGTSLADLKRRQALYTAGHHEEALAGWPAHPAYVYGNKRLSCALCVLATTPDLTNGANHNPATYRLYLELEVIGGATFKNGFSLTELPVSGQAAQELSDHLKQHSQHYEAHPRTEQTAAHAANQHGPVRRQTRPGKRVQHRPNHQLCGAD